MPLLKVIALVFAAWLLFHWTTAGQDEIIKGPPKEPNPDFCVNCPVK
jgi:hypothetical protein